MSKKKSANEIVTGRKAIKVDPHNDTLNDVLGKLGMTSKKGTGPYVKDIIENDEVITSGTSGQIWLWLRTSGRIEIK